MGNGGVGHRAGGRLRRRGGRAPVRGPDGPQPRHRAGRSGPRAGAAAVGGADGGGRDRAVADRAAGRLLVEPAGPAAARSARSRRRGAAAPDRAQDVALLRDVRERREPPPPAGQFPGIPGTHAGAAHLSDQHRARPAVDAGRARLRVHPHLRHGRAARGKPLDAGGAGALRGPRPQLVRHDQPGRTAAAVRVHGRQRQPGGIAPEPGGRASPRRSRAAGVDGDRRRPGRRRRAARRGAPGAAAREARHDRRRNGGGGTRGAAAARGPRSRRSVPRGRRCRGRLVRARPGPFARSRRPGAGGRRHALGEGPPRRRARAAAGDCAGYGPRRAAGGPRPAVRSPRERDGLPVPVRHAAEDVRHRLPAGRRRGTRTPRSVLLRPARLRSAPGQLHRHREGRRAAGALVPAGAPGHECRRPPDAPVLERHDVRVPDAAARDEELPGDASRPDLPDGRAPAAGVRAGAGRALGHLRVGVQPHRPPRQLPVPRVRRARPRAQAGARRRPGGGPLCHRARGDGRPARGRGEPPAAGARGPRRPLRLLRGHRLHAAQDV